MYEANVGATQRVLDAAIAAGVPRIVYISTVNVFGNTHGRIVDETYRRDLAEGFLSYYDETKYLAHVAAEARIEAGAPIVIVQPGTVYGAGDHSGIGAQLKAAYDGTAPLHRLRRAPASRRHTSTTSPAASSRRSIADGSARPTS